MLNRCHIAPQCSRVRNNKFHQFQVWNYPWQQPQKGVTQLRFIYLKAPRVNPMPYRSLVFSEYGMTMQAILSAASFAYNSKPKSGMKKG